VLNAQFWVAIDVALCASTLARSRVQIAKREKMVCATSQSRKTLQSRLRMNHFNSCSPKSVWYYIMGVNVHVKFISFLFRSVLFASGTFSCCAALGKSLVLPFFSF